MARPKTRAPAPDRHQREIQALLTDGAHAVEEVGVARVIDAARATDHIAEGGPLRPHARDAAAAVVAGLGRPHAQRSDGDLLAGLDLAHGVESAPQQQAPAAARHDDRHPPAQSAAERADRRGRGADASAERCRRRGDPPAAAAAHAAGDARSGRAAAGPSAAVRRRDRRVPCHARPRSPAPWAQGMLPPSRGTEYPIFSSPDPIRRHVSAPAGARVLVGVVALAVDAALGEPPARLHPVVGMGSLLSAARRRWRAQTPSGELAEGAAGVIAVVAASALCAVAAAAGPAHVAARRRPPRRGRSPLHAARAAGAVRGSRRSARSARATETSTARGCSRRATS